MNRKNASVLVADDEETIRTLLEFNLSKLDLNVLLAGDGIEAVDAMTDDVGVVFLDLKMPRLDGIGALQRIKKGHPNTQVIMISAHGGIDHAVEAMKLGALDYVTKPFDLDELLSLAQNAVNLWRELEQGSDLKNATTRSQPVSELVGESEPMIQLMRQIDKIADLPLTALITGESGTGKSLLARVIHQAGNRRDGPFVGVSCPSLPNELLESEMFGHEKGAFTGALARRIGRVEMADGGTLFLDEIGDLPMALQPKLLTFLQERRFMRVGGAEELNADVRVIAATNVDLKEKVEDGSFREDLFFRLNVIQLEQPPLRRRASDIPLLVQRILSRISQQRGERVSVTPAALECLQHYSWPGNIRELENALERTTALCESSTAELDDLPPEVRIAVSAMESSNAANLDLSGCSLAELERAAILQTLESCGGNKAKAARQLGIAEKSIYNKMARFGLEQ